MIKAIASSGQNGFTHILCKPCSRLSFDPPRPPGRQTRTAGFTRRARRMTPPPESTRLPSAPRGAPLKTIPRKTNPVLFQPFSCYTNTFRFTRHKEKVTHMEPSSFLVLADKIRAHGKTERVAVKLTGKPLPWLQGRGLMFTGNGDYRNLI